MQNRQVKSKKKFKLHMFKGKGVQPGVDLDSTASLLDIMEPHAGS